MRRLHVFADSLFWHEMLHFSSGVIMFFLLYRIFGQIKYGIIAFIVSLFIDSDHYFEGVIVNGLDFSWIFKTYPCVYWEKLGRVTILLHSWELLPLIFIVGKIFGLEPLALAIVLPAILHYSIDNFIYSGFRNMPVLAYSLIYRLYHRFNFRKLCPSS